MTEDDERDSFAVLLARRNVVAFRLLSLAFFLMMGPLAYWKFPHIARLVAGSIIGLGMWIFYRHRVEEKARTSTGPTMSGSRRR